ncbi:MAG: class I SAM-dependent methyltransferase [Chitinispirillaceae bacterium]|nr:class I SAM-dependent methyltransferase [Chitinispirillaceae bacterium]
MDSDRIKRDIIAKYEEEAAQRDQDRWYAEGSSPRVPESKASHYFIDRKVNEALSYCSSCRPDLRVLEIGCSFGHMTFPLSRKFSFLTAMDLSPRSVEIAKRRLNRYGITNVAFVSDDAETMRSFPDNSFDVVFSFSTIRFCPNPENALASIYAKLDANGIVIVDFPNNFSPWHLLIKPLIVKRHIHDHLYTELTVKKMIENAGFKNVETKVFLFTTKRLPDALLPLGRLLDAVFERLPMVKRLGGIIMARGYKR